jgi:hypothetical protein
MRGVVIRLGSTLPGLPSATCDPCGPLSALVPGEYTGLLAKRTTFAPVALASCAGVDFLPSPGPEFAPTPSTLEPTAWVVPLAAPSSPAEGFLASALATAARFPGDTSLPSGSDLFTGGMLSVEGPIGFVGKGSGSEASGPAGGAQALASATEVADDSSAEGADWDDERAAVPWLLLLLLASSVGDATVASDTRRS